MKNLKGLTCSEIEGMFISIEEPKFRAKQLCEWIYQKKAADFLQMTNFSKGLREKLAKECSLESLHIVKKSNSSLDEAVKYLFQTADGEKIETVLIPDRKRNTLCVSTQVGCPLGCVFCLTGDGNFKRDLEVWEIVDQIISVQNDLQGRLDITNIVFMGMGEPLLNYKNTVKAIAIINAAWGLNIGARKITISTAGIAPAITKLAGENLSIRLAISLNAADNKLRNELMPINKQYPLEVLIPAVAEFSKTASRFVTFEYILIKDVNDSEADAALLIDLLKGISCKINLITYNESEYKKYQKSLNMAKFKAKLDTYFKAVTIRQSSGSDILAACGQLRGVE